MKSSQKLRPLGPLRLNRRSLARCCCERAEELEPEAAIAMPADMPGKKTGMGAWEARRASFTGM
jgi:hypothetical protein